MYRDQSSQPPDHGCGVVDDFGRCSARYHDAGCLEVLRGAAATNDTPAADVWVSVLRRGAEASGALLANEALWDELEADGPASGALMEPYRELLGTSGARQELPPRPDTRRLAEQLGLR